MRKVLLTIAAWACLAVPGRAEDLPSIVLTADTQGQALACEACPSQAGQGGLARRATALADLRKTSASLLLLDAGNALIGADSVTSGGGVIVAGYNALAYDAVNISFRDFRFGKAQTLAVLKEAKFAVISANLLDDQTGQPLFSPYVVKKAGAQRIAILGVADLPEAVANLPHMKRQLAGVRVQPVAEALAAWLPKARAEADAVVLLYYGTSAGLAPVREKFGKDLAAILVGGIRPEQLPPDATPPMAATSEQGRQLALLQLGQKPRLSHIAIDEKLAADPAMEKVLAPFFPTRPLVTTAPAAPLPAGADLPARIEDGRTYAVRQSARNRAAELRVQSVALLDRRGETQASPGHKLLVIQSEWENVIPLTMAAEKAIPTMYQIPKLAEHLYAVINGRLLARLHPKAGGMPGHVSTDPLSLKEIGTIERGALVFEIGAGAIESLDLRLYDYVNGHAAVALAGKPSEAKPVSPTKKNEVIEAGVYGLNKPSDHAGQKAPEGMTFVVADLRAVSLATVPSGKDKIGAVADWKDWRKHTQLVVDGQYAYAPLDSSTLDAQPRFLPDVPTGGDLAFLAPAKCQSIELRCDFPGAMVGGRTIRPAGLVLAIEGTRPAPVERPAIVAITDDMFGVSVVGQTDVAEAGGQKAPDGERFLLLDVTVKNAGKSGEFFRPVEQLKCVDAKGKQTDIDAVCARLPYAPPQLLWIPAGEQRSFQVAYSIAQAEKKPRLAYAGVSLAKIVDLKAMAGPVAVVVEPPTPVTKPVIQPPVPATEPVAPATRVVVVATKPVSPPATVAVVRPPVRLNPRNPKNLPQRVTAKQDATPKGLEGVGLTAQQVNAAIDKGAQWLWQAVKKDLYGKLADFGGRREHLLYALALVHADAHKKIPEFRAALEGMLGRGPSQHHHLGGYESGLFSMLVESYGDATYLPALTKSARYLLEAQGPDGSWTYQVKVPSPLLADPMEEQALRVSGGAPLDGSQLAPWKRLTDWTKGQDGDNSVSQFALLGLHAASRSGIVLPQQTWERNLKAMRDRHNKEDGGWGYTTGSSYGSMTCAGVCALAINRHELGEKEPPVDEQIELGLGWLSANFSVTENPGYRSHDYYYLYSLERVGRILDTEFIGDHEWYPLGARRLVDAQHKDGNWPKASGEGDEMTTSFALLFLTRATPTLKVEPKRGGNGTLRTSVILPPEMRLYFILDASGSMLAEMDGRRKFDVARDAVVSLIRELPDNSELGLRAYGHRTRGPDEGSSEDTELLIRLADLRKDAALATLAALRPRGRTPMALSLLEAKRDLAGARAEAPVRVVLLTDGGEDTFPRKDPVKAAAEFGQLKGVQLHVVGFDINQQDWSDQLQAMAKAGGGQYYPAARGDALLRELRSAVFGTPDSFAVYDMKGSQAARGHFGEARTLPEGKYRLTTEYGGREFSQDFWINTDATTAVVFNAAKAPTTPAPPASRPVVVVRPTMPVTPTTQVVAPAVTQPAAGPRFCTNCGKPLNPAARFCTNCGTKAPGS